MQRRAKYLAVLNKKTMEDPDDDAVTILDVLEVDICRREILGHVDIQDIVRSETVSRRWQHMVLEYLQTCHNINLIVKPVLYSDLFKSLPITCSYRTIDISSGYSQPRLCRILEKMGSSILSLSTSTMYKTFWEIIDLNCPHLRRLNLSGNGLRSATGSFTDQNVCEIIHNDYWQEIKFEFVDLTGYFLKSMYLNNLTSLGLNHCSCLEFQHLYYIADRLQNIKKLEFDGNSITMYPKLHLLFKNMPKLEYISLCDYDEKGIELSNEFIETFSQLHNLKRLVMRNNGYVNRAFLDGLARGCEKLECLDIANMKWRDVERSTMQVKAQDLETFLLEKGPADVHFCFGSMLKAGNCELMILLMPFISTWQKWASPAMKKKGYRDMDKLVDPYILQLQLPSDLIKSDQKLLIKFL